MRNFSPSCERNQDVIFEQLQELLGQVNTVLEIGSGSGQHALFFQQQLIKRNNSSVIWQCSDRGEWLADLALNITDMAMDNVLTPIELDVDNNWPSQSFDMIYTANSIHIMSWENVENLFKNLPSTLQAQGYFCCYGPFKYNAEFTSESNQKFEQWLKGRDAKSGIKDFEAIEKLALQHGIQLVSDITMPANNQLLVWQRV